MLLNTVRKLGLQDDSLPTQGRIEDEVGDEPVRQNRVALLLRVEELDVEICPYDLQIRFEL